MVYAVSDIHGCYDKFRRLLEKLSLTDNDTLYVLGDIVDRGDGGIEIIKDLMTRKNVITLRGNHDVEACQLLKSFVMSDAGFNNEELVEAFKGWLSDGGMATFEKFDKLSEEEQKAALDFLDSLPLYKKIKVGGKKYFLAHTVPECSVFNYPKCWKPVHFVLAEPQYEQVYNEKLIIVTGHTPTSFIDLNSKGRIWKGNNHIAIDCGAVFGNPLGCICLDTMEEFYSE